MTIQPLLTFIAAASILGVAPEAGSAMALRSAPTGGPFPTTPKRPEGTKITAANGVNIQVAADARIDRNQYAAPIQKAGDCYASVVRVLSGGRGAPAHVKGGCIYSGTVRRYETATFTTGEAVKLRLQGRAPVSCGAGCTNTMEGFRLDLTTDQVVSHARRGIVTIQLRAATGHVTTLKIPSAHFEALAELTS